MKNLDFLCCVVFKKINLWVPKIANNAYTNRNYVCSRWNSQWDSSWLVPVWVNQTGSIDKLLYWRIAKIMMSLGAFGGTTDQKMVVSVLQTYLPLQLCLKKRSFLGAGPAPWI